jgi:hypothetical protein
MKKTSILFIACILFCLISLQSKAQSCTGFGSNTVICSPNLLCPGSTATVGLLNPTSGSGMSYQWKVSNFSNVGPFTVVANATLSTYATPPLTVTCWYICEIMCGSSSVTANSATLTVGGAVTNMVPYLESFQSIGVNNDLPNCSWSASGLGSTCLTYTASPKYAAFYYNPAGSKYFYSNGLQLYAGITYSAGLMYKTDNTGGTNWSDLSLLIGPNQNTTGQFTIASTSGPAANPAWTSLTNTFTVNSSGVYYPAMRGTGSNSGTAQYLSWDDLFVNIPCSLNSPAIAMSSNANTICAGQSVVMMATGADSFTWTGGSIGSAVVYTAPVVSTPSTFNYTVAGTNTLTGCSATSTLSILVNPSPVVTASASPASTFCAGNSVTLSAYGAGNYFWSNGASSSPIVVSPASNVSYSVIGTNSLGCSAMGVVSVSVSPSPVFIPTSNSPDVCMGDSLIYTAVSPSGPMSYTWTSASQTLTGNPVTAVPLVSSVYTVVGTNSLGCQGMMFLNITVFPKPSFTTSPSSTICVGSSATLSTISGDPLFYTWEFDSNTISAYTVNVSPTVTTIYTVTAKNIQSCILSKTISVTVIPSPTLSLSGLTAAICAGDTKILTVSGASTYQWQGLQGSGNTVAVSPLTTQVYTVIGTAANGCTHALSFQVTVNDCTGLTEKAAFDNLKVYPNPGNGNFIVELQSFHEISLTVFDVSGKKVFNTDLHSTINYIQLNELKAGIYYGVVASENGSRNFKIVKE